MCATRCVVATLALLGLFRAASHAADAAQPPGADQPGLAAQYPGDEGIERDPRVLFVDDFETGSVGEIGDRWGSIARRENLALSDDVAPNSPGTRALQIRDNGHLNSVSR